MTQDAAVLKFKTISLSTRKDPKTGRRKPCSLTNAAAHNLREIQAELGADDSRIDASRMRLNHVIHGPKTAAAVQALASELLAQQAIDVGKLRRDYVQAIEAVFSLPQGSAIDPVPFFEKCRAWVSRAMGLPVLSAVIHLDEAAPHAHVLLLPVKDGQHQGASLIERTKLARLLKLFDEQVGAPNGLQRSRAKFYGKTKEWAAAAVLREYEARGMPTLCWESWGLFERLIRQDPTPHFEKLRLNQNRLQPDNEAHAKPIGLDPTPPKPIGFAEPPKNSPENVNLSCVGFALTSRSADTRQAPQATHARPQAERMQQARQAMQRGIQRSSNRPAKAAPPPFVVARDDGCVVDRSEGQDW